MIVNTEKKNRVNKRQVMSYQRYIMARTCNTANTYHHGARCSTSPLVVHCCTSDPPPYTPAARAALRGRSCNHNGLVLSTFPPEVPKEMIVSLFESHIMHAPEHHAPAAFPTRQVFELRAVYQLCICS